MTDYLLTFYGDDDVTEQFTVGTAGDHLNPYLSIPEGLDSQEIDALNGSASIGQITLSVIDPQTGATKADRFFTGLLGTADGYSALHGRRAWLRTVAGREILNGVAYGVRLNDSYAGFTCTLKDIRERPRKVPAFTSAARWDAAGALVGAPSVIPRGRLEGYGKFKHHPFLTPDARPRLGFAVPPVKPFTATVASSAGLVRTLLLASTEWPADWQDGADFPPELVVTDAMREATSRVELDTSGALVKSAFPDVRVLWRLVGGATWTEVMPTLPGAPAEILGAEPYPVAYHRLGQDGETESVRDDLPVLGAVYLGSDATVDPASLPTVGTTVEFLVIYVGEPTEDYPYVFEGQASEFLEDLYDGRLSRRMGTDGTASAARAISRYDAAVVGALTTPVRLRQEKKRDDARAVEEEFYHGIGYAPAIVNGQVSPVYLGMPDPNDLLAEITDDAAMPVPGWDHDLSTVVTSADVRYRRDWYRGAEFDPTGERSAGDGIASREITVIEQAPEWALDLVGDQPHEIDGWMYRAIGAADGQARTGDVLDERGAQVARSRGAELVDRWLFGGQTSAVRVRMADFPTLAIGDWVTDSRSWRPNYHTLQRGGPVIAQVVHLQPVADAWWDLVLVDGGPNAQPLAAPTLGVLSESDGEVTVPVSAVPGDADARVDYAISTLEPAEDSGLWSHGGRRRGNGDIVLPPVPADVTVWVRARSEQMGRRPSSWTAAQSVATSATPRILSASALVKDDGSVLFQWDPNVAAAGVRIHYEAHEPGTTPTLSNSVDVDGSSGSHTLPAGTVDPTQVLTADVEPWTGWSGTAVSGTAGARVRVTTSRGAERDDLTLSVTPLEKTEATHTLRITRDDTAISEVWRYSRTVPQDAIVPAIETVQAEDAPVILTVPAAGYVDDTITVPEPDTVTYVWYVPYTADLEPGIIAGPVEVDPLDPEYPEIDLDDDEDATTGTQWVKITERGLAVAAVEFQTMVGNHPASAWSAPTRSPGAASVVKGGTLREGEYEHDVALATDRFSWITGKVTLETGEVQVLGPFGFDRNKQPDFIAVRVSGTNVEVSADSDTASIELERIDGGGTWSKHRDGRAHTFDVTTADDSGNAGITGNAVWVMRITAYSDPKTDVSASSLATTQDVTVESGSGGTAPLWADTDAFAPVGGSADAIISLLADANGAVTTDYEVKVHERYNEGAGWSMFSEVTNFLSPVPADPPTTKTDYTRTTRHSRVSGQLTGVEPLVKYEWRCEIREVATGNVADSSTVAASWYTDSPVPE